MYENKNDLVSWYLYVYLHTIFKIKYNSIDVDSYCETQLYILNITMKSKR